MNPINQPILKFYRKEIKLHTKKFVPSWQTPPCFYMITDVVKIIGKRYKMYSRKKKKNDDKKRRTRRRRGE